MSEALPSLIQAVDQAESSGHLIRAVRQLAAAHHADAIPTLMAVLSYNNPGAAIAAVDGLVALGEPAVPALLEQLDQHNYTARSWAIRALAGIGDPRGLVTLLGAATADFSPSVRRAAARGLGAMQWQWFPANLLEVAQEEALEALVFVVHQDEEWVVRYAAVVGLQSLVTGVAAPHPDWRSQIEAQLTQAIAQEATLAVKARAWMSLQQLQSHQPVAIAAPAAPSPLSANDWQNILDKLYERKEQERSVFAEGDPRRYKDLAVAIAPPPESH